MEGNELLRIPIADHQIKVPHPNGGIEIKPGPVLIGQYLFIAEVLENHVVWLEPGVLDQTLFTDLPLRTEAKCAIDQGAQRPGVGIDLPAAMPHHRLDRQLHLPILIVM